jgi:hypothetical protein
MAMASKWTSVVPSISGNYWISKVEKGKLVDPQIAYLSLETLLQLQEVTPGLLMFGDSKIAEPLWEKI